MVYSHEVGDYRVKPNIFRLLRQVQLKFDRKLYIPRAHLPTLDPAATHLSLGTCNCVADAEQIGAKKDSSFNLKIYITCAFSS